MRKKTIIIFLLTLSTSLQLLAGGGWTQKKNHGYFKLSQYVLRSDRYFNPEGGIIDINPGVAFYSASIYGEYGLTDRLTATLYFPFFTRSVLNNLQRNNGEFVEGEALNSVGDTDIGFQYALTSDKPIAVSLKLTLGIPFGNPQGGESQSLQTGDGEFNQMISLDVSRSFYPVPIYVSAYVGFNNRTNDFSDEFRYGLEAGVTFGNLTVIGRLNGIESLMNGDPDPSAIQGVFANNIEFASFTPEVVYTIKDKYGFSASVGTAFSGRQVLANPSYEGGFFIKI